MRSVVLLGCLVIPVVLLGVSPVPGDPAPKVVSFDRDVEPILAKYCQVCHGGGQEKKGDFDATRYETVMKGGRGGKAVRPGKAGESLMVRMMLGQQKPIMPPPTEDWVPIEEILVIRRWIDQGARGPDAKKPER